MAKTVDITASYIGSDITEVDIYDTWPGGTLLSGSFNGSQLITGVRLTGIADSVFSFVLVDTVTSASSSPRDLPGPTISEFNPTSGTVGDTIGVTGSGFIGTTSITLGTKNVTNFITSSNTNLTLTVPSDASGSTFLIISNPKGDALRAGWQYTVGGNPVDYNLGDFAFELDSNLACADTELEYSLYSDTATSIQGAFDFNSLVYTDELLSSLAPIGWYKEIPSINSYIYYVDENGRVSDRVDCASSSGGSSDSGDSNDGGTTELPFSEV